MFSKYKAIGIALCGFALGILLAFFLPANILIIIEAALIIAASIFFSFS